MIVNVVECIEGARRAKGLVVVIDVFRAFSVACYAVDNGVEKYFAVGEIDLARKLAVDHTGILVGERDCIKVEGFDYGNSPAEIEEVDFSGKTVVHTTSAGTQGLVGAVQADEIITGSFVNAGAIVEYIREQQPEVVTLVAMGTGGSMRAQEDMMCAMYIKNELEDYPNSFETLKNFLLALIALKNSSTSQRSMLRNVILNCVMNLNRFDFVLRAEPREDGAVCLSKVTVASA